MFLEFLGFAYLCISLFYLGCGTLYLFGSKFMHDEKRMEAWFPLVYRKKLNNVLTFLWMFGVFVMTVAVGIGLWYLAWWAIVVAILIAAFEVYLGMSFYLYDRTPQEHDDAIIHMVLHAIIGGFLIAYVDLVMISYTFVELYHKIFG